jgi:hypothetical protein
MSRETSLDSIIYIPEVTYVLIIQTLEPLQHTYYYFFTLVFVKYLKL